MLEIVVSHLLDMITWLIIIGGSLFASIILFGSFKKNKEKPTIEIMDVTKRLLEKQFDFLKDTGTVAEKSSFKYKQKEGKGKLYILDFKGSVDASEVDYLRNEITAILSIIEPSVDEVLIKISSGGGTVCGYGLVASQLQRFNKAGVKVTASVDEIAASGGYMAACVASKIIAAPFSYIGSIGVVSEMPNFTGLMDKIGITYSEYTAGDSKRVISQFRENSKEQEKEYTEDLNLIHKAFIAHVSQSRPAVEFDKDTFTGKSWLASEAMAKGLVDQIQTSDEFIESHHKDLDKGGVYEVTTHLPKDAAKFIERLVKVFGNTVAEVLMKQARP